MTSDAQVIDRKQPPVGSALPADGSTPQSSPEGSKGRPRVLVVDDTPSIRRAWCAALETRGFSVYEASNGLEGIEVARATAPDLVIMDLAMPIMDGIRATAALKADQQTGAVPVLAVTGDLSPDRAEAALLAGAERMLLKPIGLQELLRHIEAVLRLEL
jgi:CheY-like chemotaxis protein